MGVFFNFDKKEKLHQDGYDVQDQHKRLRQHFPGSSFLKAQKGLFAQHAKGQLSCAPSRCLIIN